MLLMKGNVFLNIKKIIEVNEEMTCSVTIVIPFTSLNFDNLLFCLNALSYFGMHELKAVECGEVLFHILRKCRTLCKPLQSHHWL